MYSYEDLFDMRSNVGAKLNDLIKKNGITKTKLCNESGVSRPTLDKVLNGTLGSKANYERHIKKIFSYLNITPDILFGKTVVKRNNVRALRSIQKTKIKELAERSGIREERLAEIEAGEEPTLAELRDLAVVLNTSVRFLKGENVFEGQISLLNYFFQEEIEDELTYDSGFWGHLGVLPEGSEKFFWFPISGKTRLHILSEMNSMCYLVIPCMNNKLLLLNLHNIKQIRLLDEACDAPEDANWDPNVDCGEVLPVIYEALEDYYYLDGAVPDPASMSLKFQELMKRFLSEKNWGENEIVALDSIIQHFRDGKVLSSICDYDRDTQLLEIIEELYCFEEDQYIDNWMSYVNDHCEEIMINLDQIAMLELSLWKVDEALYKRMSEE